MFLKNGKYTIELGNLWDNKNGDGSNITFGNPDNPSENFAYSVDIRVTFNRGNKRTILTNPRVWVNPTNSNNPKSPKARLTIQVDEKDIENLLLQNQDIENDVK